jgi:hypothetical protein
MYDVKPSEVAEHIKSGIDYVLTGRDCLSDHLRGELQQVMSRVRPQDLSTTEITGLLDILRPADCRVIGRPAGRPGLRILGVCAEHPAPEFV